MADFGKNELILVVRILGCLGYTRTHPIGVNVSKPLAALHGSPCFFTRSCRFLAVISTAKAARSSQMQVQKSELKTYHILRYETRRSLQICPDLPCQ